MWKKLKNTVTNCPKSHVINDEMKPLNRLHSTLENVNMLWVQHSFHVLLGGEGDCKILYFEAGDSDEWENNMRGLGKTHESPTKGRSKLGTRNGTRVLKPGSQTSACFIEESRVNIKK